MVERSSIGFQLLSESVEDASVLSPDLVSRASATSWRSHCILGRAGSPPQVFPGGTSFITPEPPATLPPLPIVTWDAIATLPPRTTKSSSVTLPLRPDCATIENGATSSPPSIATELPESAVTPEEAIAQAENQIFENLKSQILVRTLEKSPSFFESLVVDLIVKMGYGGSRESVVQRLGKSGDEGIDGVVNEDALGLDVVYIQAKRYAADNTIGRERIQQFAGALVGQGASKGVFVTTSSFSKGAVEYAIKVPQRIILIDGKKLDQLMVQYGVGVRVERTVEIKRIDLDYFDEGDE